MFRKPPWLLTGMLLWVACRPDEIPNASKSALQQDWEIGVNEKVFINNNQKAVSEKINIALVSLEDSRCPANAMCIRQGAAVTTFQISEPGAPASQTIRLFIGDFMSNDPRQKKNQIADTASILLSDNTRYQLILKQVVPYPGTGEIQPKANITLRPE